MKLLSSKKNVSLAMIVLALIGMVDSSYLTYRHFIDRYAPCNIGGCEVVLTSKYSEIYGIPTALFGILYYVGILSLVGLYLYTKKDSLYKLLAYATSVGFITSFLLVYIQLFILESICLYCMVSAATSTLLFVIGLLQIVKRNV